MEALQTNHFFKINMTTSIRFCVAQENKITFYMSNQCPEEIYSFKLNVLLKSW